MYYNSDPFNGPLSADILMRTFDDLEIVAPPSLLGVRNLVILVGLLLAVVVVLGGRAWILERKVRRKTAALGYIERRRSRILEAINGSHALVDILEQITELVSCMLDGAPSWFQIAGGAQIGNCPRRLAEFRIVQQEASARAGPGLGTIFAALDPLTTPRTAEQDALEMSSALAALAIETRRLHSDLLHRSEFDQLTSAHNRFSFDKRLDALVAETRNTVSIFGFIYIDLDKFKQINDLYGHHIGDRYLQEVALRMTKQLRSQDLLARLGGDEFAVLVPAIGSREGVAEIARRLERCIDEPFSFDGCTIHGSVSVGIAIYPEDGATKDILLKAADAAMYAAKNSHRMAEEFSAHGE
jgi:diguanylate cyclase (GGDEF)-like protein